MVRVSSQYNSIMVKQLVMQLQLVAPQRKGQHAPGRETIFCKFHLDREIGFGKIQHIIGEVHPGIQRDSDTRMTAKAEIHSAGVVAFHSHGYMKLSIFQRISDGETKAKRIYGQTLRRTFQ